MPAAATRNAAQGQRHHSRGALPALLAAAAITLLAGCQPPGPPGPRAPAPPVQTDLAAGEVPFQHGTYRITPLANFDITALVLSRTRYYFGRETALSPVDLVLGWGAMSDRAVLDEITIFQYDRRFRWQTGGDLPVPRDQIEHGCANMHLLPADATLSRQIRGIRRGQLVRLRGWLVRIDGADGGHWISSLSREDTGSGSCEVIWVRSCEVLKPDSAAYRAPTAAGGRVSSSQASR